MKKILGLVFALVIILSTKSVDALTLTPIRLEITGDPGQTLTEKMTLVNEQQKTVTYYSSYQNFEAQGDTGSPTFVQPKDDLGTWISTPDSVTLEPGQQKIVDITIKIPKSAEAGGHFAAVFWGTTPNNASSDKQVLVSTKTGLLVLLSVNGDITESAGLVDFQLKDHQWFHKMLPVGFAYRFSNNGSDRVKPKGNVIICSILGWRVAKVDANPSDGNVLPRTTRKFIPQWAKRDTVDVHDSQVSRHEKYSFKKSVSDEWHNFAVGIFSARVKATFGDTDQEVKSKHVYFIVFPPELMLIIVIIALGGYFLLRFLVRRYNRSIIKKAERHYHKHQVK